MNNYLVFPCSIWGHTYKEKSVPICNSNLNGYAVVYLAVLPPSGPWHLLCMPAGGSWDVLTVSRVGNIVARGLVVKPS